jgi:hypothetical protein
MSKAARRQAPPGSSYADQRPYAVVESLDDLRGPNSGVVTLDQRLHWSGIATFDLGDRRRQAMLYETVLREASDAGDLVRWLDGAMLVRLWPNLVLPRQVRGLWQSRFEQLGRTAA